MPYTHQLRKLAEENNTILPGFVRGDALHQLLTHARLFVLPSSHEGLPIALLEALSYGLPVLASDIPANVEVGLDREHYFPVGEVSALSHAIARWQVRPWGDAEREAMKHWVTERYNWADIASATSEVYRRASA